MRLFGEIHLPEESESGFFRQYLAAFGDSSLAALRLLNALNQSELHGAHVPKIWRCALGMVETVGGLVVPEGVVFAANGAVELDIPFHSLGKRVAGVGGQGATDFGIDEFAEFGKLPMVE